MDRELPGKGATCIPTIINEVKKSTRHRGCRFNRLFLRKMFPDNSNERCPCLVVVRALAESPWGVFTVGATVPIALFMGGYMRFLRVGNSR